MILLFVSNWTKLFFSIHNSFHLVTSNHNCLCQFSHPTNTSCKCNLIELETIDIVFNWTNWVYPWPQNIAMALNLCGSVKNDYILISLHEDSILQLVQFATMPKHSSTRPKHVILNTWTWNCCFNLYDVLFSVAHVVFSLFLLFCLFFDGYTFIAFVYVCVCWLRLYLNQIENNETNDL